MLTLTEVRYDDDGRYAVLLATHFNGAPESVTEFLVPVSEWSDGPPAHSGDHAH